MLLRRLFMLVFPTLSFDAVGAPASKRSMCQAMLQHLFARWQDGNRRRTHRLHLFRLFLSELFFSSIFHSFVWVEIIAFNISCFDWVSSARKMSGAYGALIA